MVGEKAKFRIVRLIGPFLALVLLSTGGWPLVLSASPKASASTATDATPAGVGQAPSSINPSTTLRRASSATRQEHRRASARRQKGKSSASSLERDQKITGRRDPFKLPPPPHQGAGRTVVRGPRPPGKKGLIISQLKLDGIVNEKATHTMIAVVTGRTDLAYFLRKNDVLYDGVVTRITPDSVYFRENYLDQSGRLHTKEVVKRLAPTPGEGR